jgi:hypothetical protein
VARPSTFGERRLPGKEVKSMALRLRAFTLVLGLSSLAALLAEWGWNP